MSDAAPPPSPAPTIRPLGFDDIRSALAEGWADFRRAPAFGLFFAFVYALGGAIILGQLRIWGQNWVILPVAVGFPLVGPFAAVGLYEVSRRIEAGEALDWSGVLGVILRETNRQIPSMAMVVIMLFLFWIYAAHMVFALFLGLSAMTNISTSFEVLWTTEGMAMLATGALVGGALALLLFSITVVGLPMLLDREVDVVTAMVTSVRTVAASPAPMLGFAALVGGSVLLALAPAFLGLFLVLPLLGHTTWRLYRKALDFPDRARVAEAPLGEARA